MSKIPILETEADTITYHIGLYYHEIEEKPEIRQNEKEHINLINHINERYLKALQYIPPGSDKKPMDYEGYKDAFIENIDFLTRVFTKQKEREAQQQKAKEFMAKTKK